MESNIEQKLQKNYCQNMDNTLIKLNMNNMWTQTTSYGEFEIKWEIKEETSEKETYVFTLDE